MVAIAEQTAESTNVSVDFNKPTTNSMAPTKLRTKSPESLAFSIQGQSAYAA